MNQLSISSIFQPADHTFGNHPTDFRHGYQFRETTGHQSLHVPNMSTDGFGNTCAHMKNSQSEQEAPKVLRFGFFQSGQKVSCRFFTYAFKRLQLDLCQTIQIRDIQNQAPSHQLLNQHTTTPLDIHSTSTAPMLQSTPNLSWTIGIGTAPAHAQSTR